MGVEVSKISQKKSVRKFPFRDVTICLDGELVQQYEKAQAALNLALASAEQNRTLRSKPGADERQKLEAIEAAMRDKSVTIRITGVSFGEYNKMVAANPPRDGKDEIFDASTFFLYVAKRTGKSVEDDGSLAEITPDEWAWIEENLTDGEHDRIASAVVNVNRVDGGRGVDFLSRNSDEMSASPEISESLVTTE